MADVFISHASEDKAAVARPLADSLKAQGWDVWLDEDMLLIGNRLSQTIGTAIAGSRYGVVVLSPSFFSKAWPQIELEALVAREAIEHQDLLLPVWHDVTASDIAAFSKALADRKGIPTTGGLDPVIAAIGRVLRQAPPNNVPKLFDATVGRDDEIADVRAALRDSRLVTIHGGAGVGKSRLAIEVATGALTDPLWGVWFIELASLPKASAQNPNLLPAEIGRVMRIAEQRTVPPLEGLTAHLSSGRHLIVLDNCEHLVEACRVVIDHLIPLCPGLHVLATSRTPLGALSGTGEHVYELDALKTLQPTGADLHRIRENESVRLFEIRARTRSSAFTLDASNAPHIAALCHALDGNPLAIEIAAARLSVRSAEQMVDEARDFVASLGNVHSGTLRRWDSLAAAVAWSFDLLPDEQQACARAMSVCEGGWSEDAVGPIWLGAPSNDLVTGAMQSLSDHSLVVTRDMGRRKRFRYLEAVRQFLRNGLSAEQRAEYQQRHAEWFCALSEEAAPHFLQAGQREWLDRIQADADNVRAAVLWARQHGHVAVALRFLAALWRFAEIRGYFSDWRRSASLVLAMPEAKALPALLSKVHSGAGMLAYRQADFKEAEAHFTESLNIETQLGNQPGMANAQNDLGNVAIMRGDFAQARRRYEQSLAIEEAQDNSRGVAVAHFNLGSVALAREENDEALRLYGRSLRGFRDGNNVRESAFALFGLAQTRAATGEPDAARGHALECLRIRQEVGDQKGVADIQRVVGWIELEAGNTTASYAYLTSAVKGAHGLEDRRGVAETLGIIALWCARQQRYELCARLYSASDEIGQHLTYARPPILKRRRDEALRTAKAALGEQAYNRARVDGELLERGRAVAAAVGEEATIGG